MAFYNPIKISIEGVPVIIYPCAGIEKIFGRKKTNSIEKYIKDLYTKNKNILKNKGQYNIIILWNDVNDKMADVWVFDKIESWGSGPLIDAKIFRNFKLETNTGVSAGDGLILLGKEEEHRRKKKSLEEYIDGDRPKLPDEITVNEDFYL